MISPDIDRYGLRGRAAAITGAGAGIGRAYARALGEHGVAVAVIDLDGDLAAATAAELGADGVVAIGIRADVTNEGHLTAAAERIAAEFGRLDILINNAGLHLPEWGRPPTELTTERWHRLLDVNVVGIVNGVRAFREMLRRSPGAVVLNQGSVAGHRPVTTYGISKLAVRGLTVALASELAADNIRVVSLAPGAVSSEAVLSGVAPERLRALVDQQLIGRLGDVEDLIRPMLFLCSDEASFVTGETLAVSGGYPLQV